MFLHSLTLAIACHAMSGKTFVVVCDSEFQAVELMRRAKEELFLLPAPPDWEADDFVLPLTTSNEETVDREWERGSWGGFVPRVTTRITLHRQRLRTESQGGTVWPLPGA